MKPARKPPIQPRRMFVSGEPMPGTERKQATLLGSILALAMLVGLQFPAAAQDASWEQTVAKAKKEGTVVLYASFLGSPQQVALLKRFENETGIKVQLLDVRASELETRIRAEQLSGRYIADLFLNSGDNINRYNKDGLIAPLAPVPNMKRTRPDFAAEITDVKTPGYMLSYGILVNSNLVTPEDAPKSWGDLLDPKWKGKILSDDVRAFGGGFVFFSATLNKFGRTYHEGLAKQELVFSRNVGQDQQRVARGEYPLRIPQTFTNTLLLRGLPVKMIVPSEGAPYIRFDFAIANHAPHPNAARVLINWYLSDAAQIGLGDQALIPIVGGLEDRIEPEARALSAAPLLGTTNSATREAELQLAKEIYK